VPLPLISRICRVSPSHQNALLAVLTVAVYGRMEYWVESIYKAMKVGGLLHPARCPPSSRLNNMPSVYLRFHFADRLQGAGTDDFRLWRVTFTVWHRGQLAELKTKFRAKVLRSPPTLLHSLSRRLSICQYGKSLKEWVHSETSGNYRNALLNVIGDT
jgi:hypothetical protein